MRKICHTYMIIYHEVRSCKIHSIFNINKVLLPLGDKLIYEHSVDKFKALGFEIICVINPNDDTPLNKLFENENIYIIVVDVNGVIGA